MIREVFLERIVHAKGLSRIAELRDGILMPTPAAVLAAAELLGKDIGDLMAIDVGGATTDVCSIADGAPRSSGVIYKGLSEPFAKRTVEGDIGMRYSAQGVVETVGIARLSKLAKLPEKTVSEHIEHLTKHTNTLPQTIEQKALDYALTALAIETASLRHAGSLEEVYTTSGRALMQTGKDLTEVQTIVMTGGALINTDRQSELAAHAHYSDKEPQSLRPKKAKVLIDKHYILAAMGLLIGYQPRAALQIMKEYIISSDI